MVYFILQHKMLRYTDKRITQQQVSTKSYNSFGTRIQISQMVTDTRRNSVNADKLRDALCNMQRRG